MHGDGHKEPLRAPCHCGSLWLMLSLGFILAKCEFVILFID